MPSAPEDEPLQALTKAPASALPRGSLLCKLRAAQDRIDASLWTSAAERRARTPVAARAMSFAFLLELSAALSAAAGAEAADLTSYQIVGDQDADGRWRAEGKGGECGGAAADAASSDPATGPAPAEAAWCCRSLTRTTARSLVETLQLAHELTGDAASDTRCFSHACPVGGAPITVGRRCTTCAIFSLQAFVRDADGAPYFGGTTVFVSYCWSAPLARLLGALEAQGRASASKSACSFPLPVLWGIHLAPPVHPWSIPCCAGPALHPVRARPSLSRARARVLASERAASCAAPLARSLSLSLRTRCAALLPRCQRRRAAAAFLRA